MTMEKVILGDNQFFAVNHLSDEKSRAQAIRFKEDQAIIDVLDNARACGINTFMFVFITFVIICVHIKRSIRISNSIHVCLMRISMQMR